MRVRVVYVSESGNAAELADIVSDRLRRRSFEAPCQPLGALRLSDLAATDILFATISTTGQGALPSNAQPTWPQLLRKSTPNNLLSNCEVALFGLGDSSYPRFNWAVRKVHARLAQLGASDLIGRGEGDEQSSEGYEIVFDRWLELALESFDQRVKVTQVLPTSALLEPRYPLLYSKEKGEYAEDQYPKGPRYLSGTVVKNSRITASDHFQDVRHVVIEAHDTNYGPGDILSLYPANADEVVDALLKNQDWPAETVLHVDEDWISLQDTQVVAPPTLRTLLKYHLDLNAIPRRHFFALASHFASDPMEQERLAEFGYGTGDALQDLYDYANRPRRSIVETILEFSSLKIPVTYILDLLPPLRRRQFSIASRANSPYIELCVAIVRYRTILRRIRKGLCTAWLESKKPGDSINFTLQHNQSHLKNLLETRPAILIATGTGIAPIRSLLLTANSSNEILLFFGCRAKDKDWLYHDELENLNLKIHMYPAFSRQGGGYVQQKITESHKKVSEIFPNALIYVCGSSGQMPNAVRAAIADALCKNGYISENAEAVVRAKEKQGLYIQETW